MTGSTGNSPLPNCRWKILGEFWHNKSKKDWRTGKKRCMLMLLAFEWLKLHTARLAKEKIKIPVLPPLEMNEKKIRAVLALWVNMDNANLPGSMLLTMPWFFPVLPRGEKWVSKNSECNWFILYWFSFMWGGDFKIGDSWIRLLMQDSSTFRQ